MWQAARCLSVKGEIRYASRNQDQGEQKDKKFVCVCVWLLLFPFPRKKIHNETYKALTLRIEDQDGGGGQYKFLEQVVNWGSRASLC